MLEGMMIETVGIAGYNGDTVHAYQARPVTAGKVPGVVVLHHRPGWNEWSKSVVYKLAAHGFAAICPRLNHRTGAERWDDAVAAARAEGFQSDDQTVGDVAGAMAHLCAQPESSGKVGVIGFCSGGRQAFLAACRLPDLDVVVDCWGGSVIAKPEDLTPKQPVAPITLAEHLNCPILGIFGNEDDNPDVEQVNQTEAELKRLGKQYEFHRYDGAGHGFFTVDRPGYRVEQAVDGWNKVLDFFERTLR